MPPPTAPEVTQLLHQWQEGDEAALDRLLPLVYDELRRQAHHHMRQERSGHTLNTTALVHEAFLNLAADVPGPLENRAHFFAIASRVMRRVLIWYARKRNAAKRGGGRPALSLDEAMLLADARVDDLLALDAALERLDQLDPRLCRVVECRYFGGLGVDETATALGISPATVKRDWQTARAWLRRALHDAPTVGEPPSAEDAQ
ncbi:MAG: sigma-70 family RNA polymerase sigma factor [Bacteroidota bacterium]